MLLVRQQSFYKLTSCHSTYFHETTFYVNNDDDDDDQQQEGIMNKDGVSDVNDVQMVRAMIAKVMIY